MNGTLFDPGPVVTPEATPDLSYGQRLTIQNRRLIESGTHPASRRPLLIGTGESCATCVHHVIQSGLRFVQDARRPPDADVRRLARAVAEPVLLAFVVGAVAAFTASLTLGWLGFPAGGFFAFGVYVATRGKR